MGRTRNFDETETLTLAAQSFVTTGFEGTSIDDLVAATGLHRGSLYQAFGSKRGIFLAALRLVLNQGATTQALDLLLVATLELGPRDNEIRSVISQALRDFPDPSRVLGDRLLARATIELKESR